MNNRIILFCLVCLIISSSLVLAQNKGGKDINLHGGKQGNILFPHQMHQGVINDCMVCHTNFAKEPNALQTAITSGMLKKKQVMNKTCLKCHRDRKKAGQAYGPVKCSGCHIK